MWHLDCPGESRFQPRASQATLATCWLHMHENKRRVLADRKVSARQGAQWLNVESEFARLDIAAGD
jgi:hypothetical protein